MLNNISYYFVSSCILLNYICFYTIQIKKHYEIKWFFFALINIEDFVDIQHFIYLPRVGILIININRRNIKKMSKMEITQFYSPNSNIRLLFYKKINLLLADSEDILNLRNQNEIDYLLPGISYSVNKTQSKEA